MTGDWVAVGTPAAPFSDPFAVRRRAPFYFLITKQPANKVTAGYIVLELRSKLGAAAGPNFCAHTPAAAVVRGLARHARRRTPSSGQARLPSFTCYGVAATLPHPHARRAS